MGAVTDDPGTGAAAAGEATAGEVAAAEHGGLPWRGRPERADLLCWFAIMGSGLFYLAMLPVRPLLIGRTPLLLELLDGSSTSIVTAGAFARVGRLPLLAAVIAPVPVTMMFDPLYWWAGRRWGRRVVTLLAGGRGARRARLLDRAERLFGRYAGLLVVSAYVGPIPNVLIYAMAGWSGMRLRTFVALDVCGTLLWTALLAGLGYALGAPAVHLAQQVSHYGLWVSLAVVAVVVGGQVARARRGFRYRVAGERQAERQAD